MIIGFSDEETVMLDFDETSFKSVRFCARRVSRRFKLGGFIVAKSSEDNYHVVFNRRVTWTENMSIVAWTALMSRKEKLRTWLIMQCIKKWPTLRVTPKGQKPAPRIVCREGEQGDQIAGYLEYRRLARRIWRVLGCEPLKESCGKLNGEPV
jgi:hypothetical protein